MNLPDDFLHNIQNSFGRAGVEWLQELPALLNEAAQKWQLSLGSPMLLSYNYVIAAKRVEGTPVVLKIGVPNREFISELTALRLFNGDGCVRLLEVDETRYMFLMERLFPGKMLVSLEDDDKRTHIACDVMAHLWRAAPIGLPLIKLIDWFSELDKVRPKFSGGTGLFPKKIFEKVEKLIPELFANSSPPVLMHGDFHHFNVLSSDRGWLAIDPKGVIGPPEYECGPLLINPMPSLLYLPEVDRLTLRRVSILSDRLGFSREIIRDWALCHAILSAWWDMNEDGSGGEYSLAIADVISKLQI